MVFLLNLAFGLLAGWLTDYVLARMGVEAKPIRVTIAVIVGVIVFLLNLASQVLVR